MIRLGSCPTDAPLEDRRWRSLEGETMVVLTGYSNRVHANKDCPDIRQARGEIRVWTVTEGRLTDANGKFCGSEREHQSICPSCAK